MSLAGKVYSEAVALLVVPGVSPGCRLFGCRIQIFITESETKAQIGACAVSTRLFITSTHGSDTPRLSMVDLANNASGICRQDLELLQSGSG